VLTLAAPTARPGEGRTLTWRETIWIRESTSVVVRVGTAAPELNRKDAGVPPDSTAGDEPPAVADAQDYGGAFLPAGGRKGGGLAGTTLLPLDRGGFQEGL